MKRSAKNSFFVAIALCMPVVLMLIMGPAAIAAPQNQQSNPTVKNVILLIGDGFGYNQMLATDYYQHGTTGKQVYQKFPTRIAVSTYEWEWETWSEDGKVPDDFAILGYDTNLFWGDFGYAIQTNSLNPAYINNATDSASSGSAMATGVKTRDGAIGVDVEGNPVPNIVEFAESIGKRTGVVSTVPFSHATPASFVAHNISRDNYAAIANEMIYESAVDVIFGCSAPDYGYNGEATSTAGKLKYVGGADTWGDITDDGRVVGADANADGILDERDTWTVIRDKSQFQALSSGQTPSRVLGIPRVYQTLQYYRDPIYSRAGAYVDPFTPDMPTLEEMAKAALNILDNTEGFLLVVEGGAIDWSGHFYQPGRLIEESIDFNNTVEAVVDWVQKYSNWGETLVIVTADHETGYIWGPGSNPTFEPIVNNGAGNMPGFEFYSDIGGFAWHSNSLVPLFAKGDAARLFKSYAIEKDLVRGPYIDNTDLYEIIKQCLAGKSTPGKVGT